MKYFIVDTIIKDGEFEYFSQSPIEAKTAQEARKIKEKEAKEWVSDDYRNYEVKSITKITKQDFDVIKHYIY